MARSDELLILLRDLAPCPSGRAGLNRMVDIGRLVRCASLIHIPSLQRKILNEWLDWACGPYNTNGGEQFKNDFQTERHRPPSKALVKHRRLCLHAWESFRPSTNLDTPEATSAEDIVFFCDSERAQPLHVTIT